MNAYEILRQFQNGRKEYTEAEVRLIINGTLEQARLKCMEVAESHLPVSDFAMGKHDGALDCVDAIEEMMK